MKSKKEELCKCGHDLIRHWDNQVKSCMQCRCSKYIHTQADDRKGEKQVDGHLKRVLRTQISSKILPEKFIWSAVNIYQKMQEADIKKVVLWLDKEFIPVEKVRETMDILEKELNCHYTELRKRLGIDKGVD